MNDSILIRQRKGGAGKSALAIALENALSGVGIRKRLIDADTPDKGEKGASLSNVFGDRAEQFVVQPSALAVEADPNQLKRHWFPLCQAIAEGGVLVDFGANTNAPFDAALKAGGWGEEFAELGTHVDVVIPVTANPDALRGGVEGIESTRRLIPTARIIMALNEKDGPFDVYRSDPLFKAMISARDSGVEFMTVPKCISTLWRSIELNHMEFRWAIAAATADPKSFGERIGMSRPEVRMGLEKLATWYDAMVQEFIAVNLVPAAKYQAKTE